MKVSSLPIWFIITLLGTGVVFVLGYVSPYISKENRAEIDAYLHGDLTKKRPVVIIKDHVSPKASILIVVLIALLALILFFIESFQGLLAGFGGSLIAGVAITVVALLAFGFYLIVLLTIHLASGTITTISYERTYGDRYGLDVEFDPSNYDIEEL